MEKISVAYTPRANHNSHPNNMTRLANRRANEKNEAPAIPKNEDILFESLEKEEKTESKPFEYQGEERIPREQREITPEEVQQAKDTIEGAAKSFQTFIKCVRIAMKIIRGDNIPQRDNKFLFDNEPEMHCRAWTFRQYKAEPEDCDSEIEEEGEDGEALGIGSGAASVTLDGGGEPSLDMAVESLEIDISV